MQVKTLIVAVIAVGAMTAASNAKDNSKTPSNVTVNENSEAGSKETFGDLMKRVLRAGDATARIHSGAGKRAQRKEAGQKKAESSRKPEADRSKNTRPFHDIISRYAADYGVPVSLAHAVIAIESNYRPSARGRAGEVGLMQIKPATARMMGYSGSTKELYHPETNIKYGMKYLGEAYRLGGGKTCGAILRYNAGHAARRMNPVSSSYCAKVKRILGKS